MTTEPGQVTALIPTGGGDTALLQDALNAVSETGTVQLAPGTFLIANELIVRLDVDIVGSGQASTVLTRADDGAVLNANRVALGLRDLTITSTLETDADERLPLLDVTDSSLVIENLTIVNAPGTGAWLLDVTGTVNDSNFDNNGWIGMWVVGESELTITGSESSFNQEGFLFDDQSDVDVIGNVASNNSGAGFWWDLEASGIASNNQAVSNGYGFLSTGTSSPLLIANLAERNTAVGFGFREQSKATATGNDANNNLQGFYADNEATPTLSDNRAVKNSETGFAWFDTAGGILQNASASGNDTDIFIDETASPQILDADDPLPAATPGTNVADPTPTTTSDAPVCPGGFSLSASRCVRVIGASQRTCVEGVLSGAQCASDTLADGEQACDAPYLLYLAAAGDPTSPGLDGTCAWFDSGGICPAGDTYNPDAGGGERFTHACKHPPLVAYSCSSGLLVGDVCRVTSSPVARCVTGTLVGTDCVEYADPTG